MNRFDITKIKNFIWDLDGTLIDSYPAMVAAMKYALALLGFSADEEEIYSHMMKSVPACLDHYGKLLGAREELGALFQTINRKNGPHNTPMMPFSIECCKRIIELGGNNFIVTNRSRTTFKYLESADAVGLFKEIITVDMGFERKPDPSSVLHLIEKYALPPESCAYIGDRDLDVVTARKAGIAAVGIVPDEKYFSESPDIVYSCLRDMLEALGDTSCIPRAW